MLKSNKAITLIMLIITIIVMLILVAVTVNTILGENGLINKSKVSVSKYENGENQVKNELEQEQERHEKRLKGILSPRTLEEQTQGNATENTILKDYIAYVNGKQVIGAMTNNGAVEINIQPGESYTVPQGYHNGNGTITAQSTRDYIYNNGDICSAVTGGYGSAMINSTSTSVANQSTYLYLYCSYQGNVLAGYTNNAIDFTNYDYMIINYTLTTNNDSLSNTTYFGVTDTKNTAVNNFLARAYDSMTGKTAKNGIVVVDLRNITGSHYFKACVVHGGQVSAYTAHTKIYSIELIKKDR